MILFASLRTRIYGLAALVGFAALSLGLLLFHSSAQSRDAFRWVSHSQEVIISLDTLLGNLREAESGLRGYLLTRDPTYLQPLSRDISNADGLARQIRTLVAEDPRQVPRAERLEALVKRRTTVMDGAAGMAQRHGAGPADPVRIARAKQLMDALTTLAVEMRAHERQLLSGRSELVETNAQRARLILFVGWPVLALMIAGLVSVILMSINRPLDDLLEVVSRFGAGDRLARATVEGRSREFKRLASAYNEMADSLVEAMDRQSSAEAEITRANAELRERGRELESRSRSIALVSDVSQRLQAIRADHELVEVLRCFLPQVLPGLAGSLYVHNSSRNLLTRAVSWGEPQSAPETLLPENCWALRRGKEHVVERPGADLVCAHAAGAGPIQQRCEPVLAGGDVLGLLYAEGPVDEEAHFRLGLLTETIALALLNEGLRKRLREQTIRDPLTGLFNRRYMEEMLALEAARALRGSGPLSIVMADVDQFKRFNDQFGHEAGDAVLRAVAHLIQAQFREGDIVCRYGGEEFIVIAPGAAPELAGERAEALRRAVAETQVEFRGQRLGPVTMSFGIDAWHGERGGRPEQMVRRADEALYRAKRLGRDRIEFAAPELRDAAE